MITGNESLLFEPRFMDPQVDPFGLYWCKDAEDMQAVGVNAVCKALLTPWRELAERTTENYSLIRTFRRP